MRDLPKGLIVVCNHDGDEYVCLDTANMVAGECPVIIYDSPSKSISRPRAENFAQFLEDDIEGFIS